MMRVVEGLMPFISPNLWREAFRKLLTMTDRQLRLFGMTSMLAGLLMLYWIK
ncbi:MAG: DUF2065 domain-containing protein [Gallionella sp.]